MLGSSNKSHPNSKGASSINLDMSEEQPIRPTPELHSHEPTRDIEKEQASSPVPDWKPSLHEVAILLSLAIISLMVSLDATIVITTLFSITTALSITATQAFWVGTSYLLTSAVTMPFLAALSDIFGRTWVLLSSLASFTIGTILCCRAGDITILLVGRCIQGVGGGGIIILSLVIITDIVPLRYRPKWFGVM
jgi:predicted MFS family arabinose efflux permease